MSQASSATESDRPPATVTPIGNARRRRAIKRRPPVLIELRVFAKAIGWSTLRAKRLLCHPDINAARKRGGRWYTTRSLLLRRLPDEAPEMLARLFGDENGE
jgi:hypothetical protein